MTLKEYQEKLLTNWQPTLEDLENIDYLLSNFPDEYIIIAGEK